MAWGEENWSHQLHLYAGAGRERLSALELSGRRAGYSYDSVFKLTGEAVTADPAGINGAVQLRAR